MTDQLYLDDSTVGEFEATVERTLADRVALDRTHFYPTGGGQPNDTGVLEADGTEIPVTDVEKKDVIYHTVDGEPPTEGTQVVGRIDWDRRHAHMRYHSAQHLLSAYLLEEYAAPTVGNQLYADRARLDCERSRFSETDLEDIEVGLNELIEDDLTVRWYEMDRARAETELDTDRTRIDLLPNSITELRIVEIGPKSDPYDRTACAGTHVSNTSEIGPLEITGRRTQGSDKERLEFELDDP